MAKRIKVDGYAGVFFREVDRIGGRGTERMYYVLYKKDGKLIEAKAGGQYRDAMTPARAARYRANLIEGREATRQERRESEEAAKQAEASRYTISKLWDAYRAGRPELKGIVTDQNRFDLYLDPAFGSKEPSELVPLDVDRIRLRLIKTKSPATVRNVLELLRRITNYGVNKRLCPPLGFRIEMPRVDNVKTEDLSPDELDRLLRAIDADDHPQAGAMMKTALYTGMRRGEMFRLQWSDLDFERGFIQLRDPKGGISQKIPMNDAARQLLEGHQAIAKIRQKEKKPPKWSFSEYVFPGKAGIQRTDIKKALNEIKVAAGLPAGFRPLHGLRHVYASMLASSGKVDLYTLQKLMTHKSPAMTQRYAHLRDDALKAASNLAGDIVGGIVGEKTKKVMNDE